MTQNSHTADPEQTHGSGETDSPSRLQKVRSAVSKYAQNETIRALAGGILILAAVRTARRNRRRAGMLALGGAVLLGGGLRRRALDTPSDSEDDGVNTKSTEARANLERSDVLNQSEKNPRGVSGEPDVETETGPGEGDIQFTTEQEVDETETKPDLDGSAEEDPRLHDQDDPDTTDDHVDISLSESDMADEASEATGPNDEQSYPASEGTDPEPMSDKAPQRYGEGTDGNGDPDDEDSQAGEEDQAANDESEETSEDEH